MKNPRLEGILPVLPTPFADRGEVDPDAFRRVAEFCVDAGAGGVVFPGVASEYDFLTPDEQHALTAVLCDVARGRTPVICGGGKGDPATIGANIRAAQDLGAIAAMVLVPRQFSVDVEGAIDFMRAVIAAAPGVDIILQNAPTPIGAGLPSSDVLKVVQACPAIRYVKEEALPSGPRISALQKNAPDHFDGVIGGGGARYVIDEMTRGAIAAMPAAEIADIHVKMWNAFQSGETGVARSLYMRTLPLLVIQTIYRMRLTKHVLTTRGVLENSSVRAPLMEFDDYDLAELSVQLESISDLLDTAPATSAVA
ncbi:MAG: dihydrodipicolinate synthase family protein [Opitutaceae bacterium]|jgi:4-hydroxy-tetrahydrodipicolinate synthase|nr:dihydrodipicolinate synthase family protein [Opitutaceae bacterium]